MIVLFLNAKFFVHFEYLLSKVENVYHHDCIYLTEHAKSQAPLLEFYISLSLNYPLRLP